MQGLTKHWLQIESTQPLVTKGTIKINSDNSLVFRNYFELSWKKSGKLRA